MAMNRFALTAAVALLVVPSLAEGQAATKRPVTSGVYSEAQARRGKAEFEANCAVCHRAEWFGGDEFKEHWGWGEVFWVYDFIRTNMPYEQGGTLPRQTYLDVVAYILSLNGYPTGTAELPTSDEGMLEIVFPEPAATTQR